MRAKIVLGLGFGDEGKGITTDYLCSSKCGKGDTINIRFSGGQQAGHTVERGGIKHIFASFGAGTLAGVPTYITEHCTIYPPNMLNEWRVLRQKGISPAIYIHPNAMCTTPYDVAYNRWREKIMEHGSCGIGVGATMRRNLQSPYKFYAVDLLYKPLMVRKLETIQEYYLREIQKVVGMRNMKVYKKALEDFGTIASEEMKNFFRAVDSLPVQVYLQNYIRSYDILQEYKWLVFEGSQGIMLDMEHGLFPNVTYAHTTSKNAIEVCDKLGMDKDDIDIYYVTRCYQTRHGNGWMSNTKGVKLVNNEGETNTFNEWQGNFKIAEIDYRLLNYAISCDSYSLGCEKSLVVTCLDQRPGFIFDYSKIKHDFFGVYENRSPIGELVLK